MANVLPDFFLAVNIGVKLSRNGLEPTRVHFLLLAFSKYHFAAVNVAQQHWRIQSEYQDEFVHIYYKFYRVDDNTMSNNSTINNRSTLGGLTQSVFSLELLLQPDSHCRKCQLIHPRHFGVLSSTLD